MRKNDRPRRAGFVKSGCGLFVLTAACLFVFPALAGCSRPAEKKAPARVSGAVKLQDSYGREVLPPENVRRVVSLSPSTTEILFALGAGDLVVGRTDYCNFPPEAKKAASVGNLTNPNIEKIASLRPDLVVASDHFQKDTLTLLEALKLPVYVGRVRKSYDEVYGLVLDLGKLVGKGSEAERLTLDMKTRIGRIESLAGRAEKKPKVYYAISFGDEGDYTAGRTSFLSYLIRTAGGLNLGDAIEGYRYSVEALFKDEPDLLLVAANKDAKKRLAASVPYNRLKAVKEGRVYEIDADLLERIGPRNVDGLEALAKVFHPGLAP